MLNFVYIVEIDCSQKIDNLQQWYRIFSGHTLLQAVKGTVYTVDRALSSSNITEDRGALPLQEL